MNMIYNMFRQRNKQNIKYLYI